MSKRRTKKDKIIAQLRRQVTTPSESIQSDASAEEYKYTPEKILKKENLQIKKNQDYDSASLFSYDPSLIKADILRTVIFSAIAFSIEIVFFLFLK
jgi:hypothetical protein